VLQDLKVYQDKREIKEKQGLEASKENRETKETQGFLESEVYKETKGLVVNRAVLPMLKAAPCTPDGGENHVEVTQIFFILVR